MTAQAFDMVSQMKSMSDTELDFIWDFLRRRRNESLLDAIDMKLEESTRSRSLGEDEIKARLKKLGIP